VWYFCGHTASACEEWCRLCASRNNLYTFLLCPADGDDFCLVATSSLHVTETDFLFHPEPCRSIRLMNIPSASETAANLPLRLFGCPVFLHRFMLPFLFVLVDFVNVCASFFVV